MAITFDPVARRIVLDDGYCTATEVYSRWCDWVAQGDNLKYGIAIRQVGGDSLGGGISIPPYYFLQNGWRIRPMEADHELTIDGNIVVDDSTDSPVVTTLGSFQVTVKYVVPVAAQAFSVTGMAPTAEEVAEAVYARFLSTLTTQDNKLTTIINNTSNIQADPPDLTTIRTILGPELSVINTNLDAKISGIVAGVDAQQVRDAVWNAPTRTLTVAAGLTPQQESVLNELLTDVRRMETILDATLMQGA